VTDSACDPCDYLSMMTKKKLTKTARTTIASIKREMQLPRLTESVRKVLESGNSPVGEDPAGRSERQ
jgi:hypothetical protein